MNLSNLNLADLKSLADDITKEISIREQDEVMKARERILEIAQSVGMPLSDLLASKQRKETNATKRVAVKYRDPNDSKKVWTGRGRKPSWIIDLEKSGKIESALV